MFIISRRLKYSTAALYHQEIACLTTAV